MQKIVKEKESNRPNCLHLLYWSILESYLVAHRMVLLTLMVNNCFGLVVQRIILRQQLLMHCSRLLVTIKSKASTWRGLIVTLKL